MAWENVKMAASHVIRNMTDRQKAVLAVKVDFEKDCLWLRSTDNPNPIKVGLGFFVITSKSMQIVSVNGDSQIEIGYDMISMFIFCDKFFNNTIIFHGNDIDDHDRIIISPNSNIRNSFDREFYYAVEKLFTDIYARLYRINV